MAGGDPGKIINGGFQPVFSREEEEQLNKYLQDASEIFLGLSIAELRSLAYDLAVASKKNHPFSRKNQQAGYEWVRIFFKRNPELALRKPQATSFYRARGFSPDKVKIFFDNLKTVLDRHPYGPSQIYNMDETGFSSVMDQVKVIARRGTKQVGRITSAEKGQLVTAVYCCNANGDYVPPMLILPGKKYNPELIREAPPNTIGTSTPSGWSNQETFYKWLQHFAEHSNAGPGNPILLVLDNSRTHLKADSIDFCRSKSITMLSLPPHTSHRLQPLDVSVFKPLKMNLKMAQQTWMSRNVPRVITKKELPYLFGQAYVASATRSNAISGFRKSGIHPFNPDVFSDADFAPSLAFRVSPDEDFGDDAGVASREPAQNQEEPARCMENGPVSFTSNGPAIVTALGPASVNGNGPATGIANEPAIGTVSGPADASEPVTIYASRQAAFNAIGPALTAIGPALNAKGPALNAIVPACVVPSGPASVSDSEDSTGDPTEPVDEAGANFLRLISEPRIDDEEMSQEDVEGDFYLTGSTSAPKHIMRRRSPRCHPASCSSPYEIRPLPKSNSYKARKGGRPPMFSTILTDVDRSQESSKPKKPTRKDKKK